MTCTITSHQQTNQYHHLESVTLPAVKGILQVRPGHAEAFINLKAGQVKLRGETGSKSVKISSGVCHIYDDQLLIIA